jgi:hypothetical protein
MLLTLMCPQQCTSGFHLLGRGGIPEMPQANRLANRRYKSKTINPKFKLKLGSPYG